MADKKYKVSRIYEPEIYDEKDSLIGSVFNCDGLIADLRTDYKLEIKSGYKVKIKLTVRDMETDLLFSTEELVYILK